MASPYWEDLRGHLQWAGLGTALIATIGIVYFHESATLLKIISLLLIIAGVVGLHLSGVDKEPLVGMAITGLHYERANWGGHFNVLASSDNVNASKYPAAEGRGRLGTIDIE